MLYRVEGIVIRSMDYGEGNKIVTLCTESGGKAGVLVRGAKKPKVGMLHWCSPLLMVNMFIFATQVSVH